MVSFMMTKKAKIALTVLVAFVLFFAGLALLIFFKRKEIEDALKEWERKAEVYNYLTSRGYDSKDFLGRPWEEIFEIANNIKEQEEKKKKEEKNRPMKILMEGIYKRIKDSLEKEFYEGNILRLKFFIMANDACASEDINGNGLNTDFTVHIGLRVKSYSRDQEMLMLYSDTLTRTDFSHIGTGDNFYGESHTRENDESIPWNPGNNLWDPNDSEIVGGDIKILRYFQKEVLERFRIGFYNSKHDKDDIIDYDAGMPIMTISNKNLDVSKILRDKIKNCCDNQEFTEISQPVNIAMLDQYGREVKNEYGEIQYEYQGNKIIKLIDVTDEIIQVFSILYYQRNNDPSVKFEFKKSHYFSGYNVSVVG